MRRGELVIVSAKGDYGKPRPAVVIQNDRLEDMVESITVCFLTTDLIKGRRFRIDVQPETGNGLREQSQVQIDKIMTFSGGKAIYRGNVVQRAFLDIHCARAHVANNPLPYARNLGAMHFGYDCECLDI